jgi:predicted GIY-YIG superfamily endonuclease
LVWRKWEYYSNHFVGYDPDKLGVYELDDKDKNTVYYGSGNIKSRLLDHLNKRECPLTRYYRFELFTTEVECRRREEELLKEYKQRHGKLPMYNERIG